MSEKSMPWEQEMSDERFSLMRSILDAPSPIGLEASMTRGVLEPYMRGFMADDWKIHTFKGNAGIVLDTRPDDDDAFSVMVIGHADKIRMQVRSIGDDGKNLGQLRFDVADDVDWKQGEIIQRGSGFAGKLACDSWRHDRSDRSNSFRRSKTSQRRRRYQTKDALS